MMRRKILLLSATAVVAAAIAVAGANVAGGQTDIHLVTVNADAKVTAVDVHDDGEGRGDRAVVSYPLLDETATDRVGIVYWDGVLLRPRGGHWMWTALLKLEDGQIMMTGLDVFDDPAPKVDTFAVTGGTGAYAGAIGEATVTIGKTQSDIVIHLLG